MNPPDHAVVLCVDVKSPVQALHGKWPMLPLRRGQAERHTPECQRNGTVTLVAALRVATDHVITQRFGCRRAVEFRMFLDELRRDAPADPDVHLPTHTSWVNQVETWLSILTTQPIARGPHHSVDERVSPIEAWKEDARPFQ